MTRIEFGLLCANDWIIGSLEIKFWGSKKNMNLKFTCVLIRVGNYFTQKRNLDLTKAWFSRKVQE